jgi:circadian clock protein KaiA
MAISLLKDDRYNVSVSRSTEELLQFISKSNHHPDCLIFYDSLELPLLLKQLQGKMILLPAIILQDEGDKSSRLTRTILAPKSDVASKNKAYYFYHSAEIRLARDQISQLSQVVDRAMTQFLDLPATERTSTTLEGADVANEVTAQSALLRQQRRLADKLRERLGYLGVYYKRNPQIFFRNLPPAERRKLLDQLKADYREIILDYFSQDAVLNTKIDELVNLAFFADVSVTQIVEIHMGLMDEFSKQLKLEGRSEEILLDYRLTLIDVIAHLCEMYRRSIPRDS